MRSATAVALTLAALLALSTAGAVALTSASTGSTDEVPASAEPRQVITIDLHADGDATWTIESRFLLEDDEAVETFHEYAQAVDRGDRDVQYDERTFRRFAARAESETGREMEIRNASWDDPTVEPVNATVEGNATEEGSANDTDRVGTISYSFTWTNFAETTDRFIVLGDVFVVDGDSWFPALTEHQRLEIDGPPNSGLDDASRPPTDGTLVWEGPHEFSDGELNATYLKQGSGTAGPVDNGGFLSTLLVGSGVLLLLVLVGAGGYLVVRQRHDLFGDEPTTAAERDGRSVDAGQGTATESTTADAGQDGPRPEGAAAATAAVAGEEDEPEAEEDEIDPELLSDEERVKRLLTENNGRMKQASIVTETDWSNAKVSQLLSKMDEEDEIDKLRIGRENLITLPEVDPTEID